MTKEIIGALLKGQREKKEISKYKVIKETGLQFYQVVAIERGESNYTIDSLLKYVDSVGAKIEIK